MDTLVTTPHDFIWKIKDPDTYWSDSRKEIKYNVTVNEKMLGGFSGVNRSFDDDYYYVNYFDYDNDNKFSCLRYHRDTVMVLERI